MLEAGGGGVDRPSLLHSCVLIAICQWVGKGNRSRPAFCRSDKSTMREKYTNIHLQESDVSELETVAEQEFGTSAVPYRTTIGRLVEIYQKDNNE